MSREGKPDTLTFHIVIALMVMVILSILLFSGARLLFPADYPDLIVGVLVQAPVFAGIYIVGKKFYRLSELKLKVRLKSLLIAIIGWLAVAFIWGVYTFALMRYGVKFPIPQIGLAKFATKSYLNIFITFFTVCFLAPLAEELLFRGFFFGALKSRYPFWTSALISSTIFGIMHGWIVFFPMLIFGVYQCYLTEENNSLDIPVLIHIINNTLSVTMAMFSV